MLLAPEKKQTTEKGIRTVLKIFRAGQKHFFVEIVYKE